MISHCADGLPSAVKISQVLPGCVPTSSVPILTIGSMVNIMPGASAISVPRFVT